jgi:subtilisin family serine protease
MRVRSRIVVVATAAVSLLLLSISLLSGAAASAQDPTAAQSVIVVLKNQDQSQPATPADLAARESTIHSIQAPVLSTLTSAGASSIQTYSVVNAVAATVPSSTVATLKSDPAVSEVIPNQLIPLAAPQPAAASGTSSSGASSSGATPLPGACAAPGKVQLDPQAIETIGADSDVPGAQTARSLGITGAGVKVAYIADGVDINNPDFIRPDGQPVFFDYKDFSGAGTGVPTGGGEAFLDASSIAAQGNQVYDVSQYSKLRLNVPCDIRIEGVAPGASLAGLSVFGASDDAGFNSSIIAAINYAVTVDHVNVLNESFGSNFYPDDQASLDVIKAANDAAVAAGTTVTVSSGDAGVTSTIGTPSTDPNVISAGASTTYRLDAQDGYGGARFDLTRGWLNDNISSFSSSGFEQDGQTVDIVAPGELNWALCSTDTAVYEDCTNLAGAPSPVEATGGTSESAPLTAGVAALVIQAYRETHGGATPSPALVKQLIVSNTDDIGAPADQQGTGRLDAYKAVVAALNYGVHSGWPLAARHGGPGAGASAVVDSSTQLNAIDQPGTPESLSDTVTNASGRPETLSFSGRALGAYTQIKTATVKLSDTASDHFLDWQGYLDNYEAVQFTVPAGENRLSASIAYQNASTALSARVRLTLIDPEGRLADYDVPQGDGYYGNSQVTDPAPGVWTAYIFSRPTSGGGTTGTVLFGASVAQYTGFGHVWPSFAFLAPGQSTTVHLDVSTPSVPGDSSGAIVVRDGFGWGGPNGDTTIPVTLRSLIPSGDSSFTAVTTGGNGRELNTGQAFYYQLDVPSGSPEVNAYVTLGSLAAYPFQAWLVDPNGQAESSATNTLVSATGATSEIQGLQLHALSPASGTWTVIVEFGPTASGTALSEPFTVATDQNAIEAGSGGLPDSTATKLTSGAGHTYDVTITNHGGAPDFVFADARLPGSAQYSLGAFNSPDATEPLTAYGNIPGYIVPTDTTGLSETASTTGTGPIQFDSAGPSGDPDLASAVGESPTLSFSADPIAAGAWDVAPEEVGPYGAAGGPTESVTTTASVSTAPFDPTVTATTGDAEADVVDPLSTLFSGEFNPIEVDPGQTATIPVTITPSGTSGTQVSGTLYVDDWGSTLFGGYFYNLAASQIAAVPYSYTIK